MIINNKKLTDKFKLLFTNFRFHKTLPKKYFLFGVGIGFTITGIFVFIKKTLAGSLFDNIEYENKYP
jgi:hypothetical protein